MSVSSKTIKRENRERKMGDEKSFLQSVSKLAIPVALQCMLQSSFSMIDQVMIGQLGSISITAVGIAGKFSSIYSVIAAAISTVAGIMIAQYIGAGEDKESFKSFWVNTMAAMAVAAEAFFVNNPRPTEADIRLAISGNICRCTGYDLIVESILLASKKGEGLW